MSTNLMWLIAMSMIKDVVGSKRTEGGPPEKKDPINVTVADCPKCGASLSGSYSRVAAWATTHVALHRYWRRRELHP